MYFSFYAYVSDQKYCRKSAPLPGHSKPSCDLETVVIVVAIDLQPVSRSLSSVQAGTTGSLHACTCADWPCTNTRAREMRSVCVYYLLLLSFPLTCARDIFANLASKRGECCRISCCAASAWYYIIDTTYTPQSKRIIIWNQVSFVTNTREKSLREI